MQMFPKLLQVEESSTSDTAFITEEMVQQIRDQLCSWKTLNDESLGELWLGLFKYVHMFHRCRLCVGFVCIVDTFSHALTNVTCRYYAVDFPVERYAVSILRSELLLRENTQWGSARLAMEGKYLTRMLRTYVMYIMYVDFA